MDIVMLIISLLCTALGIAIGDSARYVSTGGVWRKLLMLGIGAVLVLIGTLLLMSTLRII